jgi:exodeoxyribonuclease-3
MNLASWNVNGLRACIGKGFMDFLNSNDFDIIGLQETKMQPEQADFTFDGWHAYWNSAVKKGYSGTLALSRVKPLSVAYGLNIQERDTEGRVITLEFDDYYFITVYTPNSQDGLRRLDYRMVWEDAFREYVNGLPKPVIICGDLNVAHKEIDLAHPKSNVKNPGFTPQEREKLTRLLDSGFTDSFRHLYPDKAQAYTWWSYRLNARVKNVGWRIDYFLTSNSIAGSIKDAVIYDSVMGSDHCPVGLTI